MSTRATRCLLVSVLLAIAMPHVAFAQSASTASAAATARSDALRAEGNALLDERRYDEALARYQQAQALTPNDAALFYNLSRVHEVRGDAVQALETMEQFSKRATPDLKAKVPVDELLATLRRKVTRLRIACTATGGDRSALARATIFADRQVIASGCTVHDLRVRAGRTSLRAEADGFVGRTIDLVLAGGETVNVALELAPRDTSGVVRLRAEPEHVAVSVGGRALGQTPVEALLPAGPHQIVFSQAGYQELATTIVVEPNGKKDLDVVRLEKTPSIVTRWWFWTGTAVLVAGAAAITYALVTERSPDRGTIEPGRSPLPLMRW